MSPLIEQAELAELGRRASARDLAAAGLLLEHLRPALARYCRARLGTFADPGDAADDAVQETCAAVLAAVPQFRDEGRPFTAFVFAIAANKVADAMRGAARRPIPVGEVPDRADDSPGPEDAALSESDAVQAHALLEQLPAEQREILLLRVVAGLSAEETAAILDTTPGALRVAQHRALAMLRRIAGPDRP
ncbi:MAG TPA: RNA polymerase sigma factor ShbA [Mycobacteriales bacterium]|nr:RNA polymerase sigma factor ShbA [Mycobacteriales bacterium]